MKTQAWDVNIPTAGYDGEDGFGKFHVITNSVNVDTVFFDRDCDREYVRRTLIDHDGYPSNVVIYRAR